MCNDKKKSRSGQWIGNAREYVMSTWLYWSEGVWEDKRNNLKVNTIKTINLTVRTFMSSDLQSRACAMAYRTLLAVVPALALLFAIGRGFGFQNILQNAVLLLETLSATSSCFR